MMCGTRSVGHVLWDRICGIVGQDLRDCMTAFDAEVYGRESDVDGEVFRC